MKPIEPSECHRPATLLDVGRAAGVSATAAAGVLNDAFAPGRVSLRTRQRILSAALELEYRPHGAARALANRRMHTLGVVADVEGGELNDHFLEVFSGILSAATRHRQNTSAFTLPSWACAAARLKPLTDGRVDGLILLAPTVSDCGVGGLKHLPVVSVQADDALPRVPNIESDEACGACTLVGHLIAYRHRRILHLAGPAGLAATQRRVDGYRRALEAAGIPFDRNLVVTAGWSAARGREALTAWLQQHVGESLPDAIFCANDAVAVGCLEVLAKIGLRVPQDISVAGFGDTYVGRTIVPRLTSVRQPLRDMGACAVELLLERIEGTSPSASSRGMATFPTEVVLRGSVGPRSAVTRRIEPW